MSNAKRTISVFYIATVSVLIAVIVVALVYIIRVGGGSLPVTGQAADFAATDINGKPVALSQLNGKIRLLTWFYTHCPDECPLTAFRMEQMQTQLKQEGKFGKNVVFISITLDPKRDTLPVIKKWAQHYHADTQNWYFLRANPEQTAVILKEYGVSKTQAANSEFIEHVVKTDLIDESGNIRKTYPFADLDDKQVMADIHNLISREGWNFKV